MESNVPMRQTVGSRSISSSKPSLSDSHIISSFFSALIATVALAARAVGTGRGKEINFKVGAQMKRYKS